MCSLESETQNELVGNCGFLSLWCTSLSTVLLGFYQLLFFFISAQICYAVELFLSSCFMFIAAMEHQLMAYHGWSEYPFD
jgi:hypothetical protein